MGKFNIVSNGHGRTGKRGFFVLDGKKPFLGKFVTKTQNCQFKLKYGTETNSNMHNSMGMFLFSFLHWKNPFLANLVKKSEIVILS